MGISSFSQVLSLMGLVLYSRFGRICQFGLCLFADVSVDPLFLCVMCWLSRHLCFKVSWVIVIIHCGYLTKVGNIFFKNWLVNKRNMSMGILYVFVCNYCLLVLKGH